MSIDFRKATVLWAIGIVVAQVPFPKHAGFITGVGEHAANGNFILTQHRTAHDRVPDTGAIRPVTGQQCTTCRRTRRRHVIVAQPGTFRCQVIDVWRFDNRIPRTREVAVTLVVRDDEYHVRRIACKRTRDKESDNEQAQAKFSSHGLSRFEGWCHGPDQFRPRATLSFACHCIAGNDCCRSAENGKHLLQQEYLPKPIVRRRRF